MVRCEVCGHDNRDGAKFCEECAAPLAVAEPPSETRKTVTIVFCDVAGSTAIGETLDPESVRRVMERYFDAMQATIQHHGGTVEKFIGDAVMAIFGVPQIHEDDALRAVRAAADMRGALATLNEDLHRDYGMTLAARIGVNTGEVVAGAGDQKIVTGDAVNVAARLEQVASPDEILLGEDTLALIRDGVIAEPIDPLVLKGKADPVPAFRLLEVTPGAAGFARHLDAPMVGRERELSLLRSAFDRTVTDHACRLFTILGAAGVGKSRLMAAFVEGLGGHATVLRGRCLPYGEGITFYPLAEALIEVADLNEADTPRAARAKLASLVGPGEHTDRIAERVGHAIGVPGSESEPAETLWAVRVLLERLATEQPVVFVIDDLQWAEPKLLELVEHVADLAQDSPILFACMARPEFLDDHPGWAAGKMTATSILLEPLSPEACGSLVANLLADDAVDEGVRTRIAEAAEGNPLYAEEITGLLVDDGHLILEDGRWASVGNLSEVPVPPTISALLAARLDTLPLDERRLIEVGSVMGQVFYSDAVRELANARPGALEVGLSSLERKQFIRAERSDLPAADALAFRHLLIRDAAYGSIPKATRAKLHERFADWHAESAGAVGEQDEILGYHLEQAYRYRTELGPVDDRAKDLGRRAGEHLGEAGLRAFARGDYVASSGLLDRAVSVLPSDHPRLAILEGRLFNSFLEIGDHERAAEANARHLFFASSIGDRAQVQRAELGAVELRHYRSPQNIPAAEMHRIAHGAIDVFEELDDEEGLCLAHIFLSESAFRNGRATESRSEAESALAHGLRSEASVLLTYAISHLSWTLVLGPTSAGAALHRVERLAEQVIGYQAAEADAEGSAALFLAHLGRFDEARKPGQHALKVYEDLGHRSEVAWCVSMLGWIEWQAGDPPAAEPGFRTLCELLRDVGDDWNLVDCTLDLAQLLLALEREDEMLELTAQIQSIIAPDDQWKQTRWRALRSVALARVGRIKEAMPLVREAERLVRATEFVATLADTMLAKAEVFKLADRRADAITSAREALALYEAKEFVPHIGRARAMLRSLSV